MTEEENSNDALEALVLQEAIVNATGIPADVLTVGIKGDPSMRETAYGRERYTSVLDETFPRFEPMLEQMLIGHSPYQVFIGFNNCEIRTRSIFDPLREEIHAADALLNPDYCHRHFPSIPYGEKISAMRDMYDYLLGNRYFNHVPGYWQRIVKRRHRNWKPMSEAQIRTICQSLGALRSIDDYYLRNATISVVQSVVRLQFNCDGTQIVRASDFQKFIEENLP